MIRKGRSSVRLAPPRGFTLIEVLVAFALVALVLGAALRLVSGGLNDSDVAERQTLAVLVAESRIAEVGTAVPLAPGVTDGTAPGGYRWRREIRPIADAADDDPLPLYAITVEVSADDRRGVRLSTLRPAAP